MAISESNQPARFFDFRSQDGSTQASLNREAIELFDTDIIEYEVKTSTLDALADDIGIEKIAFLKIDTEGSDINVLRSAHNLLKSNRISAIQFEIIPADLVLHVTMRDFFEILKDYDLYRLCLNGQLWPLKNYDVKKCEVYVIHNIIAIRKNVES